MKVADQAWVTLAVDEDSAVKALVILKSLRRVLTSRKVIVLLSDGVPPRIRSLLEEEFDSFFSITFNSPNLQNFYSQDGVVCSNYGKIFCWSLPIFRKCVFLDTNCIVLKNCDGIFEKDDISFCGPMDSDGKLDTSVFLFSPASKTYKNLIKLTSTANVNGSAEHDCSKTLEMYFGEFINSQAAGVNSFDDIYKPTVCLKNGSLTNDENDLRIVFFGDDHPIDLMKQEDEDVNVNMGILEQGIYRLWEEIFLEHVEPLLSADVQEVDDSRMRLGFTLPTYVDFGDFPQEPIAIIGMSCRYPGANNVPEFWELLINGRDGIRQVTPERWTKKQGCVLTADSKTTQAGFLNCSVEDFDGKFFGISPMELSFLDPQQRMLLEVIYESIEDSLIDPSSLKNSYTGVYIGEWTNDYKELLSEHGNKEFYRTYMGNSPGSAAGRISFFLGLTGPSVATESGCSSAMVAVDLACKSLRSGETRLTIAAGVNLLLHPFSTKDMSMVCAPDGHCKTFDADADGFGRAEGCGSMILKRYSDAVNDGDKIWALIRGTGVAQEGPSRSLGTPTVQCEALAMKKALINSGVKPSQVSYVETHGTGTPVGDPMEVAAIAQVYAEGRIEPLTIGSVKTNVGHTESCSGITGIMKVVLSLNNEMIPPHRNLNKLNPNVKLEAVPAEIPLEPKKWEKVQDTPRFAGVSSFGITGTDAHAIIQETPLQTTQQMLDLGISRPQHILAISAKNEAALDELLKTYEKHLSDESLELADAAFSANTGRAHMQHRVAVTGKTTNEILKKLQNNAYLQQQTPENKFKICFLFTGQGSQYPMMAKTLYDTSPVFRMNFDKCEKLLSSKYEIDIKSALWDEGNNNSITRTIYSQTSIFCVEYCLLKLWESWGVKPDCVLGHSLGEFAAACAAGILNLEDAVELVAERSRLIDKLPGGKMIAIKANKKNIYDLLEKFNKSNPDMPLDYAAVNSNEQVVLAGSQDAVDALGTMCSNIDIKTHVLGSTHAFHSRDMDPMLPEYRNVASKLSYGKPTCTYISGMEGKVVTDVDTAVTADYWVRHTRESVRFEEASKTAYREGCRMFLEVGPQPVLCALTMMNCGDFGETISCLPSLRKTEDEWTTLLNTMGKLYVNGFDINWKKFDQYFPRQKVSMPFYPFQKKPYWIDIKGSMGGLINGTVIHPLIGCSVPNATPVKMYQSSVDLKKETYIKDHCIGTKVIFPAACYMEMCLAAGHATTQCCIDNLPDPGTPLTVENLIIEAPLCINDIEACEVQTLASSEDMTSVGYKIAIHRRVNAEDTSNIKWRRHSYGEFSPYAVGHEVDKMEQFSKIQSRCTEPAELTEFYNKLNEIGLKFGETFRSLKCIQKGEKELIAEINIPENSNEYLCHPVVIDSMIQALMLSRKQQVKTLIVPITIRKFTWFSKTENSKSLYVHCHPEISSSDSPQADLYNEDGKLLAIMVGAELIETTVDTILTALEQQKLSLPNLYEEAWRPRTGPLQNRACIPSGDLNKMIYEDIDGKPVAYNDGYSDEESRIIKLTDELTYMYIVQAFYELGWVPKIGNQFDLKSFTSNLQILESHQKLIRHLINSIFVEEGIVKNIDEAEWEMIQLPPKLIDIPGHIFNLQSAIEIQNRKDVQMVVACGSVLAKVLSGKESALGILFPDDPTKISANDYYTESNVCRGVNEMTAVILKTILTKMQSQQEGKEIIRFLEVGGGTGSSTKAILPILAESKIKYEYTFTDISKAFFIKTSKAFETYEKNMKYKVLNIEDDPKAQGFIPHHYDFIIASNVMHATRDLSVSVGNVRHLLRDSGMVLLVETNKPCRQVDLIFGLLEGYWVFSDFDIRPHHTVINGKSWETVLQKNSFIKTSSFECYGQQQTVVFGLATDSTPIYRPPVTVAQRSNTWIILSEDCDLSKFFHRKMENVGKNVVIVTPSTRFHKFSPQRFQMRREEKCDMESLLLTIQKEDGNQIEGILYLWGLQNEIKNQKDICQPFFNLSQIILETKFKAYPKLYLFTGGIMPVTDQEPVSPVSGTLWGLSRSLRSEQPNLICRSIDSPMEDVSNEKFEELFMEIWNSDGENQVAYRDRKRHVLRLTTTKMHFTDLTIPNSCRFHLTLPSTKTINDLKFDVLGTSQLQGNEIELKVKAAGLNFRDVFNVLKPDAQFEKSNSVGADFSGIVTGVGPDCSKVKVGDCVVGCNFDGGALPSHVKVAEDSVVPLPSSLTFAEGATLPCVFATAYYCLITIGKLKEGETILIHTASGGVGLCAIQLAKWIGAKVIATAGSKRKRAYLRSLGIDHVFHSRNLTFGSEIERVTNGQGVHMVLNSITGPGFKETSLKACGKAARFVEMSKLSIWENEEVEALRPDVYYTIVDLTAVSKETWNELFGYLNDFLKQEMFRPIPYVRFDGVKIREALTYLQKAKHVGKVVCIMPEMEIQNGEYVAKTELFNDRSTYLITGGLGGIGMEVAKWMTTSGAHHVVLVGRSEASDVAANAIQQLRLQGKNIIVENIDVGNFNQCQDLIERLSNSDMGLPPIRGIMHAAGCLSDAIMVNQSWDKFEKTFNAKVNGGWNLHQLTLKFPLEHFVMFSSVVALFGPIGQSNHAASNSFLDSLAHYRINCGLPATTINWGQWGQVGVAAGVEIAGLLPFSKIQGIGSLEAIMKTQKPQMAVLECDFSALRRLFPHMTKLVEELKLSLEQGVQLKISSEKFWEEYGAVEAEEDKYNILKGYIENILRQILKFDKSDPIDENQNLQEMGLDSLMMVEMKNWIQALLGSRVSITASVLQDCHNLYDLTTRLVDLIEGSGDGDSGIAPLTKEELNDLIKEDSTLPDHIVPSTTSVQCLPSEVKTVLITGTTGNLAPYMLQAISQLEQIEKIYCLVRPNLKVTCIDRVQNVLKEKGLAKDVELQKVECISGNLGEKFFGLDEEVYTKLSEEVDGIIHCAVKSNHIEPYRKSEKSKRDIRTINVGGTLKVLEFATTGSKLKLVFHASTMVAITKATEQGDLPETYPAPTDFNDLPNVGYGVSKFICDRLMCEATERGIPVKSLRFPGIAGDSKTGHHTMLDNHLMLRMISYLKMGYMPSLPLPLQILPVDICALIGVKLFFKDECPFEVYNITNPYCPLEQSFVGVAEEMGYKVKVIEYSEFIKKLEEEGENSLLFPLKDLYFNEETFTALSSSPHLVQAFMLRTALKQEEDFFRSAKLQRYVPEMVAQMELSTKIIKRDLLFSKNAGVFKKLGLES